MKTKLRITKKKHRGLFTQNCIGIKVVGVNADAESDEFLDSFDAHYHELVPMVTASSLRKAFREGSVVDVETLGVSPNTRRHEGYVAYHDGDNVLKLTFSGPAYSVNPDTQHSIVKRLREITGKDVQLFETCFDAWYD